MPAFLLKEKQKTQAGIPETASPFSTHKTLL